MEYILHTNFLRLMTSLTFWGNVLLVLAVTAITYWVVNKILALLHKRIAAGRKSTTTAPRIKSFSMC